MTTTEVKKTKRAIKEILFEHGMKFNVTESESAICVFVAAIIMDDVIEKFREYFKDFYVAITKSKPEEIKIEIL